MGTSSASSGVWTSGLGLLSGTWTAERVVALVVQPKLGLGLGKRALRVRGPVCLGWSESDVPDWDPPALREEEVFPLRPSSDDLRGDSGTMGLRPGCSRLEVGCGCESMVVLSVDCDFESVFVVEFSVGWSGSDCVVVFNAGCGFECATLVL